MRTSPQHAGRRPGWRLLAVLLAAAGVGHVAAPRAVASIVPRSLGGPYPWVYASAAAQVACATALTVPRTRRRAALATAALFVAMFPANVTMAADALASSRAGTAYRLASVARLPLQVPLVLWALGVARRAGRAT